MVRHILFMLALLAAALGAGVALVPGDREQWTMLMRDERNQEALRVLEAHYAAGKRDLDASLNLYKLLMSFAEIGRATKVAEQLVADNPNDAFAVTLLAKHYGDNEDRHGEIGALERLQALSPSLETARQLLSLYRLEGAFDSEEKLLRSLLASRMISPNDAERLGLLLAGHGDLEGAREALLHFDETANPERMLGRLALFDVLVQLGDKPTALAKAATWIPNWRKVSMRRPAGPEVPAARLVRMMMTADEPAARKIICEAQRGEPGSAGGAQDPNCVTTGSTPASPLSPTAPPRPYRRPSAGTISYGLAHSLAPRGQPGAALND
jgi:Flp pilus assembly protein TadD